MSVSAQTKHGTLEIEIGDVATPYITNYSSSVPDEDCKNHKDTVKLRVVDGIPVELSERPAYDPFGYGSLHYPTFHGGNVDEYCLWLSRKLIDTLSNHKHYTCDVYVFFTVSDDGSVVNVHSFSPFKFRDDSTVVSLVSRLIQTPECWNSPMTLVGQKYNIPLYIKVMMNNYSPLFHKRVVIHEPKFKYADALINKVMKEHPYFNRNLPDSLIYDAEKVDTPPVCHQDIHKWIKEKVQDRYVFDGYQFSDTSILLELVITSSGWVYSAKVIKSDNDWLGEWLADQMLWSPQWFPAKVGHDSVAIKMQLEYNWKS